MKRKCLMIAVCLLLTPFFVGNSMAWETTGAKLAYLSTTDNGLAFELKFTKKYLKNVVFTCKSEFILPNTDTEYNLKAALLMTASAQKKKISVVVDDMNELSACPLPITSLTMY